MAGFLAKDLITTIKRKGKKYTDMVEDDQEILNLINEGKGVLLILARYKTDAKVAIERI